MKKRKKPKKVGFELIHHQSDVGEPMYALLERLVATYHKDLAIAKIALAWCTTWKADTDGRMTLGMCKKASDLDRQLHAYDFIILLNQAFWTALMVTDEQRQALLDHELCHAAVRYDEATGDPFVDESGRVVFRIRKHDLEEFSDIAERYGYWKRDLEAFAQALARGPQQKLEFAGR